jgi:hypothetical protein
VSPTPRRTGWISKKLEDRLLVLCSVLVSFSLPTSLSEVLSILFPSFLRLNSWVSRKGSPVLVSRADPLEDVPYTGNVVDHKPTQIKIAFQESFPELEEGTLEVRPLSLFVKRYPTSLDLCRLDLGQSNIAHERMVTAISRLSHDVPAIEQAAGRWTKVYASWDPPSSYPPRLIFSNLRVHTLHPSPASGRSQVRLSRNP